MSKIVKDTPIRKNNKTYKVGEEFPYSDKDKKLLWNLTEVKAVIPKDEAPKKSEATKKPTTKMKVVAKKKTNSKK